MRTQTRIHRSLVALLVTLGCSSSPSETPMTTTNDDDDDTGDSVTEGITLSSSASADSTGTTDPSTTVTDPATGDTMPDESSSGVTDPTGQDSTGVDDTDSSSDGSDSSSTDPTMVDKGNTIYEVQDGTLPEGAMVEINNVIVTGVASNGVMAQEPAGGEYSGVFVFSVDGPDVSGAQIGDVINISGVTGEYMGNTEIDITLGTYELVDTDMALDAEVIEIAVLADDLTAEPWEGVLVRIEADLEVQSVAASNEFVVSDGVTDLRVDDFLYELPTAGDFAGFGVGATFTAIQGPVNYFNNIFKIAGRDAYDFDGYAAP